MAQETEDTNLSSALKHNSLCLEIGGQQLPLLPHVVQQRLTLAFIFPFPFSAFKPIHPSPNTHTRPNKSKKNQNANTKSKFGRYEKATLTIRRGR
eukprot:c13237_g1_i1 orf=2-283(-)